MAFGGGFAGGFADTDVVEVPVVVIGGGFTARRAAPVVGSGRAVMAVRVGAVSLPVEAVGSATVRLQTSARAYDPLLDERADRVLLAAALAVFGRVSWVPLPLGQEEAAWDHWLAEEWDPARRLPPPEVGS